MLSGQYFGFSSMFHEKIKAMFGMLGGGENICGRLFMMELLPFQVIPDHGNRQRGGHCLKAFHLNLSELNIKFFIKNSMSVASKLIDIKKPPENLVIISRGT